jgi:hypothetical protein
MTSRYSVEHDAPYWNVRDLDTDEIASTHLVCGQALDRQAALNDQESIERTS